MSKEIYISTTPHETRLAIVEDEQLAEIYFERENEYTLAGSIYNGKVTRVLPGMQSSFVDIGLERDAFLYVTDFMEEQGDAADFDSSDSGSHRRQQSASREGAESPAEGGRERSDRGRGRRRDSERSYTAKPAADPTAETESTISFDEPIAPAPVDDLNTQDEESGAQGSRRWRGRRGRRRGRSMRDEQTGTPEVAAGQASDTDTGNGDVSEDTGLTDGLYATSAVEIDLSASADLSASGEGAAEYRDTRGGRGRDRSRGRGRDRRPDRDADRPEPMFDNSYAGYGLSADQQDYIAGGPSFLPGESIRKYRDPAEVAAEDAVANQAAAAAPVIATPTTPDIQITGWDGGAVLPGESLGRHRRSPRNNEQAQSARQPQPSAPVQEAAAVNPIASPEDFPTAIAPEEPTGLTDLHGSAEQAPVVDNATQSVVDNATQSAADDAAQSATDTLEGHDASAALPSTDEPDTDAEFEPEEGASATLAADPRRDLSRFEQPAPPQENEADLELTGAAPDQTTYDLHASEDDAAATSSTVTQAPQADPVPLLEPAEHEVTTLQASGEMLDIDTGAQPVYGESLSSQNEPHPADPIAFEGAVRDSTADSDELVVTPSLQQDELDDADDEPIGVHAYGDGDFHEEELDEELDGDDFEYQAAYTALDEADEEYEEETLDEADEAGIAVYQTAPAAAGVEEETADTITFTGGFTEADFGGDPSDDEEDSEAAPSQPQQRDSSRRQGVSRERRGGRGGNDRGRGRGRQSVQTMDLPAINDLLKPGQEVLVQIAKEPIAKKGARITSHIALPGRFLVFMPTVNHTGVSRKISSDEERRRLKALLLAEKGEAQGGFIVRTAAAGASDEELRNDLRFLIQMWTDIKARSESSKSPALIYHDLNLVERILRDQVTDNFSAIWVDTEAEYERVLRFLQRFQPSLVRRVKLYTKETPLFEHFGVTAEIDKALKSKVWLKSGGSIVINQTEALVAIDINTGKYVGKTARLEDTILKTNLDAIPEIVRQIRLRDLGGIIVIDFIDMDERKNRAKVLQTLEDAMKVDRAPSKILPFNDFGLVIMTRKRVKQSLERTLCMPDPITEGTGMIKSPITIANEIYIEMRKMYRHLEKTDVMLRVHPEVVKTLKANGGKRLQELEDMTRKTILVKSDPALSPEAFDIH